MPDQTILWTVTTTATQDGSDIDLVGRQLYDELTSVGEYVAGSFAVSGLSVSDADLDATELAAEKLQYTFPTGAMSPKTITFKTKIADEKYYATTSQTISNTVQLQDQEKILKTDTFPVTFTPKWIEKSGTANDQGSGIYDPTNRTITWTITANQMGAAMDNVVITDALATDLSFGSAKWQTYDSATDKWVDQGSITPTGNEYLIPAAVTTPIRLIIVSKVKDDNFTTDTKTFNNTAEIKWGGLTSSAPKATSPGVTIGYSAISKSGKIDYAHQTVRWTVDVNMRGQTVPDPKVYDLLVYGGSFNKATAIEWPSELDPTETATLNAVVAELAPRAYHQKYVGNFAGSIGLTEKVYTIKQGGVAVADLLVVEGFSNASNSFSFDSMILNPNIFAGNIPKTITNTATLFSGSTKLKEASKDLSYNSRVLAKEMLERVPTPHTIANVAANVDKIATSADKGFHYIDKSVIFRLVVNADGLDMTEAIMDASGKKLSTVTVADQLPQGWGFVPIEDKEYLIFQGVKQSNGTVKAKDTAPDEVVELSASLSGRDATFTFTKLDRPYIILVKAKPDAPTLAGYFNINGNNTTVTNTLRLKSSNWTPSPEVKVSLIVKIASDLLTKDFTRLKDGILNWTIEYKPYDLEHSGTKITDTLPIGLDLRMDKNGRLLIEGNITLHEMILKADGNYDLGNPVALQLGQNLSYDNEKRELSLAIPDRKMAYRLSYITDITGDVDESVKNQVSLSDGGSTPISKAVPYTISKNDVSASMKLNGSLQVTKTKFDGTPIDGAEFTLYALDGTTVIRRCVSNTAGIVTMKVLPDGDYLLKETKAPLGYLLDDTIHTVKVMTTGIDTVVTTINGKSGTDSNKLTVINYQPVDPVGTLMIEKIVAGAGDIPERTFDFTLNLSGATGNYTCQIVNIATGAVLRSQELNGAAPIKLSLAHGERAIIKGLPAGTTYVVSEDAVAGYVTASENTIGTISKNGTLTAKFTNYMPGSLSISKTVAGEGGDKTKAFEFTVNLFGAPDIEYTYTGVGVPGSKIRSGDKISLKHGQTITILGLPKDAQYEVNEENYIEAGYTTISKEASGTIVAGIESKAEFTNTRHIPGTLTIQKTVEGLGDASNKSFSFTVIFKNAPAIAYHYTASGIADGTIKSGDTISLSHGQSITILDLPPDTEYEITEADYLDQGYVAHSKTQSGTITTKTASIAAFVNYKPGNLTITKTVDGNVGDLKKKFDFVVSFEGTTASFPYTGVGVDSGTIKSGDTISLAHGESITVTGLPKDIVYHVAESDYRRDGYVTTATGADGAIIAGGEQRAEFINTRNWYPSDEESTGTLVIKKTVTGRQGDQEQAFTFVVEFEGTYDSSFYYTGSKSGHIKTGQRITLAHGEQVEISGIPVGTAFKVTEVEANQDGYYSTSTGVSGKMGELGRTANFVNTKSGVPNTGDDASNGLAKVGLVFFTATLGALIGLDIFLRRKESGNETL